MIDWDETDFLRVLEVAPQVEEDGSSHLFVVEKDGLRLEVCVFQYQGDVSVLLYRTGVERPLLRLYLVGGAITRRVKDKRGEFLEILGAPSFGEGVDPVTVRLSVHPSIQIELV